MFIIRFKLSPNKNYQYIYLMVSNLGMVTHGPTHRFIYIDLIYFSGLEGMEEQINSNNSDGEVFDLFDFINSVSDRYNLRNKLL